MNEVKRDSYGQNTLLIKRRVFIKPKGGPTILTLENHLQTQDNVSKYYLPLGRHNRYLDGKYKHGRRIK